MARVVGIRRQPARAKPTVPAAHHNRVVLDAQRESLATEEHMVDLLVPILEKVGRTAARNFTRVTRKATETTPGDRAVLGALGPHEARGLLSSLALVADASVRRNSTMIAVKPTLEQAERLAMADPDAAAPESLHVTLAYLGEYDGDLRDIADVLTPVANAHAPLSGQVGGIGQFGDNGKGAPSIVLPSVPGLVELRVAVTQALVDANIDYGRAHGYQPHMTITYDNDVLPSRGDIGEPLTFADLLIVRGDVEVIALPLVGAKPLTADAATRVNTIEDNTTRQLLAAEDEKTTSDLQTAQSTVEERERELSHVMQAGDAEELEEAKARLAAARKDYNRKLASARAVKKAEEAVVVPIKPPTPGDQNLQPQQAPPVVQPPAAAVQDKVKNVSDATEKANDKIDEEKKAREDERKAAKASPANIAHDVTNPADGGPDATPGDFDTGGTSSVAEDVLNAERKAAERLRAEQLASYWPPPTGTDLVDAEALEVELHHAVDPTSRAAALGVMQQGVEQAGVPNLAFDVTNPFAHSVLAQSASQIKGISETTRGDVMQAVTEAHDQGLSIPATAKLIQAKMVEAAPARARLIARTELAGAVNGGSLAATQIVSAVTGDTYTKQWLTAPGAEHPRHELYPGLDQQTAPLSGTFEVGGDQLKFPGDPDGSPGEVCNCRCTLVYLEGSVPNTAGDDVTTPEAEPVPETPSISTPAPDGSQAAWSNPALNDIPLIKKQAFPGEDTLPASIRRELSLGRTSPIVDVSKDWAPSDAQAEANAARAKLVYLQDLGEKLTKPKYDGQMMSLYIWQTPEGDARIEAALRSDKPLDSIYLDKKAMPTGAPLEPVAAQLNSEGLKVTYNKESQHVVIDAKQMVQGLDDSIDLAPPIERPMTVYRGMQTSSGLFGDDGPTVGEIVTDKGYQSTSILPEAARNYADPEHTNVKAARGTSGNPTVLQIALPKGQHGFLMEWTKGEDDNYEYLLPRGMSYQVDSVVPKAGVLEANGKPYDLVNVHVVPKPGTLPPQAAADLAKGKAKPGITNEATAAEVGDSGYQADIGITPFRANEDEPVGFYDSPKYKQFLSDVDTLAPRYGVTVDGLDQQTGIWAGETEPSVSLRAHDGVLGVQAYAADLANAYSQDGVLLFDNAGAGDVMATFSKALPEAQVFAAMKNAGIDGGRFTIDGKLQVIGSGPEFVAQLEKLNDELGGIGYDAAHGGFNLLERDSGDYKRTIDAYGAAHPGSTTGGEGVPLDQPGQDSGLVPAVEAGSPAGQVSAGPVAATTDADVAANAGVTPTDKAAAIEPMPTGKLTAPSQDDLKALTADADAQKAAADNAFVNGLPIGPRSDWRVEGYPSAAQDALQNPDNRIRAKSEIAQDLRHRLNDNPAWNSYVHDSGDDVIANLKVGDTFTSINGDQFEVAYIQTHGDGELPTYDMKALPGAKSWAPNHNYEFSAYDLKDARFGTYPKPGGNGVDASEQAVAGLVDKWAATAADSDPWALAMQQAAEDEFGLKDDLWEQSWHGVGDAGNLESFPEVQAAKNIYDQYGPALRAFQRAQYDATQEWLRTSFPGQESITLYRGQGIGGVAFDAADAKNGFVPVGLTLQPASSFAYDVNTARQFAPSGEAAAVMGTTVPFDRILSTARTGQGCLSENEFIVLGDPAAGSNDTGYAFMGGYEQSTESFPLGPASSLSNGDFWDVAANGEQTVDEAAFTNVNVNAVHMGDTFDYGGASFSVQQVNGDVTTITNLDTDQTWAVKTDAVEKAAAYHSAGIKAEIPGLEHTTKKV